MDENWYAIYRSADGELLSVGTEVATPLPPGVTALLLAGEPDFAKVEWDIKAKNVKPRGAPPESR